MQKVICFVILAFAMAAKALTPAERNETIENFANMRSVVEPEASNMQMLRYSAEFEKLAEDWVDDCLMGTKIWDTLPEYRGLGRSFAINFYEQQSPADMVYRFSNEMFNYDYEANTCSEICGNYTQVEVIWATSNAVGCAIKLCPNIRSESGDPAYLMAYQYKPACMSTFLLYMNGVNAEMHYNALEVTNTFHSFKVVICRVKSPICQDLRAPNVLKRVNVD
ncbi:unnamed protein product [Mesocestoides corti]|uniref:SCP domain-containing protein n=1 Tax=Mesocestoides corti TaxID=53468 RepID=A0A0R3ULZ4_MESCO|nr:unnamed protein product [Mesocestoides corti]